MPTLNEMTPDELAEHLAYVESGRAGADFMAYHSKIEALCAEVTEKVAAKRDLQEIVWDSHGVIRFRENTMVTALRDNGPSAVTKGVGDWAGGQLFLCWPPGWELDQFKKLVRERNGIIRWLLQNGPGDMNEIAEQGVLEMTGRGFSQKDYEQFAMLIGYSVSGAGDLSYFSPAMINRADVIAEQMVAERDAK